MKCRICNSTNLFSAIDLGNLPIAGELLNSAECIPDIFQVHMLICQNCTLGQLSKNINPSRIFERYGFRTSYSELFLEHSKKFVEECLSKISFNKSDWVLELASNDGYLLKIFKEKGIDVLGVDPSSNISMYAICEGIPTITDFFNSRLAKEILRIKGYPRLIVAKNVLAHTPDIKDFMEGISILCNESTIVSIENPSIMNILNNDHFDSIYHEHYSYLSANSVNFLANEFKLRLFDIKRYDVHGGSNRYWISKNNIVQNSVKEMIAVELQDGILNKGKWNMSKNRIDIKIKKFQDKINNIINNGGVICGYAASGKASTIINYSKIDPGQLVCIADDSFEKQGKFFPNLNIPVVSLEEMLSYNPTDIIIFSWNIYEDLKNKILKYTDRDIKIWCWDW